MNFLVIISPLTSLGQATDSVLYRKINVSCHNCSIEKVFGLIENELDYYFSYNTEIFKPNTSFTFQFKKKELCFILDSLINRAIFDYQIIDNQIVIFRKKQKTTFYVISNLPKTDTLILLNSKIIDKANAEPVAFATIYIDKTSYATISNNDGEFSFKIPVQFRNSNIVISSIGYKNYVLPANLIQFVSEIKMIPEIIPIQEVIIRRTEPKYLIEKVLEKKCENYYDKPMNLISFYRETLRQDDRYLLISEAIIKTYKSGYCENTVEDRIKIIKGRQYNNFSNEDSLLLKMKAGLNITLLLDLIKNPADFLSSEYFSFYNYTTLDIEMIDDRLSYVIDFKQKENIKLPMYIGRIFIDVKSLAINEIDFSLNEKGIEKEWSRFVLKKPKDLKVKPKEAKYTVKYHQINNKYFINYIKCELALNIRRNKNLKGRDYFTKVEMGVNEIDTNHVELIKLREKIDPNTIFTNLVNTNDESFWKEYNFIKPDTPLKEAIDELLKK